MNVVVSLPDGSSCKIILEKSTVVIGCDNCKLLCNVVVGYASVSTGNALVLADFAVRITILVAIHRITTREKETIDIKYV